MKISKQARREGKELFRSCLANGVLHDNRVRLVVQKTLELKPRGYLASLSHFQRLVKLELDRRTAKVDSAFPLPDDLKANVQAALTRLYGSGLNIIYAVNPALIGGMRIKVGSDVYDGSIHARLAVLQQSF
jgi:F-type H+-transporting ATPase subunit delta